jgi:glycosyltransferase involved in cell wall biosynthesis
MDEHPSGSLVSVIVATNRRSPFLDEALASVAAQTHPHVDVVVVDDGSPDPDQLARLVAAHPGVRLLRRTAAGVSSARNAGVAATRGDHLVFLDDDDRWDPRRLAVQLAAMRAADAVLGYCGMRSIDETGAEIAPAGQSAVADEADVARRQAGIILPNVMVRRDAFEAAGGFRPELKLAEDLDLVLTLAGAGPFAFSPEVLVDYRAHGANTTRRYRGLARAVADVVRGHAREARRRGDVSVVDAHRVSLRANGRFAWWAALRSARAALAARKPFAAGGDVAWALVFAPLALPDAALRRLRRDGAGSPRARR